MVKKKIKSIKKQEDSELYHIAYELGVHYLEIVKNNVQKPAVMFDIDDTLLYIPKNGQPLKPIVSIIRLLNYCLNNEITVIIITARDSRSTKETKDELKKWNIGYNYLYLRQSPKDDYQYFKNDIKKEYSEKYGFDIIMSVGDNDIDIVGDYSGYGLKLPDNSDSRLYEKRLDGNIYII